MRILALVTDAFGGHGGIAKFNRDLLAALCSTPQVEEVVALPRIVSEAIGSVPEKLRFLSGSARGKVAFIRGALDESGSGRFDIVWCGHVNLLPLAWIASRRSRAKLVLNIHGIEVWEPHQSWLVRRLLSRVDHFVSVSNFTKQRLLSWARLDSGKFSILPNCVDLSAFGPGPKNPALLARYGLEGKTVLMTLARLSSAERYKGIDEVLEVLPELARDIPNLAYLICGEGDDRPRLMAKAASLGMRVVDASQSAVRSSSSTVSPIAVFTGRISEAEKADHYRLADAFVMAGWGEGFGIAYLEALACGVPVVGSVLDASQETLLRGKLGVIVDPKDNSSLVRGILCSLSAPRIVPPAINTFNAETFDERVLQITAKFTVSGRCTDAAPHQRSTLDPQRSSCLRRTT